MVQSILQEKYETNIGKIFNKLIKNNFLRDHKLHKIFITNTIKLRYLLVKSNSTIKKHFYHHKQTENHNLTAEIQPAAHSTVNILLKALFINQLYQQSSIVIHITVAVKASSFAITTIQKHIVINIIKTIQNFLNIYVTLKGKNSL